MKASTWDGGLLIKRNKVNTMVKEPIIARIKIFFLKKKAPGRTARNLVEINKCVAIFRRKLRNICYSVLKENLQISDILS